jgi:hypothetical protein
VAGLTVHWLRDSGGTSGSSGRLLAAAGHCQLQDIGSDYVLAAASTGCGGVLSPAW